MDYRLARNFSADRWPAAFNTYQAFGADGYIYVRSVLTTANDGSNSSSGIFLKIDDSTSAYQYKLVADIEAFPPFLIQLNEQGAAGYRLKAYLFNGTQPFNVYVRDASRPSAKYFYQYGRCVSNQDDLFVQINKYAAQGYRLLASFSAVDICILYIKDTSKMSKFVYEMVPDFNKTGDYLSKLNELGARGYRDPAVTATNFVSNGTISLQRIPLYYRDKTQKDCTFSYTSAPLPTSPNKLLALLQKEEAKGFIFSRPFHATIGQFLIFVKIRNCQYKSLNIDGFY